MRNDMNCEQSSETELMKMINEAVDGSLLNRLEAGDNARLTLLSTTLEWWERYVGNDWFNAVDISVRMADLHDPADPKLEHVCNGLQALLASYRGIVAGERVLVCEPTQSGLRWRIAKSSDEAKPRKEHSNVH
jgi:hypothetical protein